MSDCVREGDSLKTEVRIAAAPERVWACLTENPEIAAWFPDQARGEVAPGEVLTWVFEGFHTAEYSVLEVEDGRRLVLEGQSPMGPNPKLIFQLEPAEGSTILRLENTGMPPATPEFEDLVAGMMSGWTLAFRGLRHYLENHHGAARQRMSAFAPADFDWPQLAPYFREPARLAEWLTTSGEVPPAGGEVRLELQGAGSLTGEVLARTDREVMLSWREADGVLQLKAFGMGPGKRQVGLDGWGYGLGEEAAAGHREWMAKAASRLAAALSS